MPFIIEKKAFFAIWESRGKGGLDAIWQKWKWKLFKAILANIWFLTPPPLHIAKGGGGSFDKNKNHGLKMHFKSLKAILVNVVFLTHTPHPLIQPEGRCHLMKGKAWSKNEFYVVLSQVLPSEILSSQRVGMPNFHLWKAVWWWGGVVVACLIIVSSLAQIFQGLG